MALTAVRKQEAVAEIARRYKVHSKQIYKREEEFILKIGCIFEGTKAEHGDSEREEELLKKIGELTARTRFFYQGRSKDSDDTEAKTGRADTFNINASPMRASQGLSFKPLL